MNPLPSFPDNENGNILRGIYEDITAFEQKLEIAAKPLGGRNDGWGGRFRG